MIQEHDVVKLKKNLKATDLEGEPILITAGAEGTVMLSSNDIPECVVEFGDGLKNVSMVTVDKEHLELIWSPPTQPGTRKLA